MNRRMITAIMATCGLVYVFFILMVAFLGVIPGLDNKSYLILNNLNAGHAERIGADLNRKCRTLWDIRASLQSKADMLAGENAAGEPEFFKSPEFLDAFLNLAYEDLELLMTAEDVTGAFVIMEGGYTDGLHGALYIKNANPESAAADKNDYMLLRGSPWLENVKGTALDRAWSLEHIFTSDAAFYEKPLYAYSLMPDAAAANLGYWYKMPAVNYDDLPVYVYTVPIVSQNGEALGVLGFELSFRYLATLIPKSDLPFTGSFYLMGQIVDGAVVKNSVVATDAAASMYLLDRPELITYKPVDASGGMVLETVADNGSMYFSSLKINLYGSGSIFGDEDFYMFAFAPKSQVLDSSRTTTVSLLVALVLALVFGFLVSVFLSRYFSGKIKSLAEKVRSISGEKYVALPRTNITEIDGLVQTIELMSENIARNASKMSSIVELTGLPMGVFQMDLAARTVFLTKSLAKILSVGNPAGREQYIYIRLDAFNEALPQVQKTIDEKLGEKVFLYEAADSVKWLRMNIASDSRYIYGAITDVTEEVTEKERLSFESSYDTLTGLLNRNSYPPPVNALIEAAPKDTGVFIFIDLDRLKILNDTYGHDVGDKYIQLTASGLSAFGGIGGVVARLSGDEFVVYLHGGKDRESLRLIVDEYLDKAKAFELTLPDGKIQQMQFSTGLAYYPDDSDDIEYLVKFADFAMREVKHSAKGSIYEYDKARYERNAVTVHNTSFVTRFLMERKIKFAFQPIIDLKTGEIVACEAVMRPQTRENHSPAEIIALAKAENKLYELEKVTFESFCEWVCEQRSKLSGYQVSFNSIPDQILSETDYRAACEGSLVMSMDAGVRIVIEMSPKDEQEWLLTEKKARWARDRGMLVAFDNYTGTDAEKNAIFKLKPEIIKVGMDVTRNINASPEKKRILADTLKYAESTVTTVITEGIETYGEMSTVVALGARYGQGFYFCPPEFALLESLPEHIVNNIKNINNLLKPGGGV